MWRPSIRAGIIGRQGGRPTGTTYNSEYGSSIMATPAPTSQADDQGRAKHYVNPHGFVGLHGFELGKPSYAKNKDWRAPRCCTTGHPIVRKGEPFKDK